MALVTCPECGQQVSEYATACPGCGYPISNYVKEQKEEGIYAFQFGLSCFGREDYQNALSAFSKALECKKEYSIPDTEYTEEFVRCEINVTQRNLGLLYYYGQKVPQDYQEAAKWLSMAAEQGDREAQSTLGWMYKKGLGVPQDDKKAAELYLEAAEKGDDFSQCELGDYYSNGIGVPQDYTEAAKWYLKAALHWNTVAQYNLAIMYENGEGVSQDLSEAIKWYTKAANQGHEDAAIRLDRIMKNSVL